MQANPPDAAPSNRLAMAAAGCTLLAVLATSGLLATGSGSVTVWLAALLGLEDAT